MWLECRLLKKSCIHCLVQVLWESLHVPADKSAASCEASVRLCRSWLIRGLLMEGAMRICPHELGHAFGLAWGRALHSPLCQECNTQCCNNKASADLLL